MKLSYLPCRTSFISKVGRFAAISIYPFMGIAVLLCPLLIGIEAMKGKDYTATQALILFFTSLCSIPLSVFLLNMSRKCFRMESRCIAFHPYGFEIRDGTNRQYEWDKIDSIGVIAYAADAAKRIYQTQICFFLEPVDDVALRKLRDSYLYGAFNLDRFVLLDYDPFIIEKLKTCKNLCIPDLRAKQMTL